MKICTINTSNTQNLRLYKKRQKSCIGVVKKVQQMLFVMLSKNVSRWRLFLNLT